MTPDQLRELINQLLAAGCGTLISILYQEWLQDFDHNPSPWAARLAVFGLCIVVPTVLYLVTVAFGWSQYDLPTNIADVVAAFTASTLWHGFKQLRGQPSAKSPR